MSEVPGGAFQSSSLTDVHQSVNDAEQHAREKKKKPKNQAFVESLSN
jgi:hypothetical protein